MENPYICTPNYESKKETTDGKRTGIQHDRFHTFGVPLRREGGHREVVFSPHRLFYFIYNPELLFGKSGFFLDRRIYN